MKPIKSIPGKLLVKVLSEEKTTESGLIVPKSEHDRHSKCEAVAVGKVYTRPNGHLVKPPCQDGDEVYIRKPSRQPDFKIEGNKYYSIPFIEVLAVIRHITMEV